MPGKLVLIGCGPGGVDLLTIRAARRIAQADLVLYDRLVDPDVVALAGEGVECRYVGKGCSDGGVQQADINTRLRAALLEGRFVARLKSGDPMVFGRAAEEIAVAAETGAAVEIIPGVTAGLAAASDALITVTERAELQSFVMTTGRAAESDAQPDWASIVKPGVCAAFYMAVAQAWRIQSVLMKAGVPGNAPADWIERAGQADVRTIPTRLDRLALDAKTNTVTNPAILLVRYPMSLAKACDVDVPDLKRAF
ncbi:uroporphyrinogen-III C-methyltransferase [Hyphomonas sp.]|uniref:uroporphyrinogen-III C-methyltransferase n=1 Tax=Hyphomonas sp. TaxID=87 RepID=UPI003F70D572